MQNAQNLMSSFEFIAALMSIIIGLGVTNLLAGAGRAFYRRKENPLDEVHIVLTVATLLLLVDRKSTRLNSSHANISYAVFCLKKKKNYYIIIASKIIN